MSEWLHRRWRLYRFRRWYRLNRAAIDRDVEEWQEHGFTTMTPGMLWTLREASRRTR